MFRRETPVYLFTGFLESGKTSFILNTLNQDYFATGEKTLIIVCEDGETEYDLKYLKGQNIYVEFIKEESELTEEKLKNMDASIKPKRVLIEYNGMWNTETIMEELYPNSWVLTQVISTVDYTTFNMFWNNMRSLLMNQLSVSDMIIFNRCDETTKRSDLRRNMKLFNKKAQIAFDWVEGFDGSAMEEELPYDLNQDVITIEDDDYGIFYMDSMENPDKYAGKTFVYNCIFYRPKKYPMTKFVPGRFAMTCCADDIQFLGILCKSETDVDLEERAWIKITAKVKTEYVPEYKDMGPVLYLEKIEPGVKPEDDIVYF